MSRSGLALVILITASSGCGTPCVTPQPASCTPLYPPTFDDVYSHTLAPTCAQSSACHDVNGKMGGLFYTSPDQAWALLLGQTDGRARVVPGDAACSLLVEKLEARDPASAMPPGAPLAPSERCAIEQWINAGAKR